MMFSPLAYAGFGFWMYGNRQAFENFVKPIDTLYHPIRYGHTMIGSLTHVHPGTPFLILGVFVLLLKLLP